MVVFWCARGLAAELIEDVFHGTILSLIEMDTLSETAASINELWFVAS
jgi:hypothetical protein